MVMVSPSTDLGKRERIFVPRRQTTASIKAWQNLMGGMVVRRGPMHGLAIINKNYVRASLHRQGSRDETCIINDHSSGGLSRIWFTGGRRCDG